MHLNKCPLIMKKWHLLDVKSSLNPYVFDLGSVMMIDVVLVFGKITRTIAYLEYQSICILVFLLLLLLMLSLVTASSRYDTSVSFAGLAQDQQTGVLYQGPCYIPKTVKTIHLLVCV